MLAKTHVVLPVRKFEGVYFFFDLYSIIPLNYHFPDYISYIQGVASTEGGR